MGKGRLETFSDGVIAIIMTVMVLELRAPGGDTLEDLVPPDGSGDIQHVHRPLFEQRQEPFFSDFSVLDSAEGRSITRPSAPQTAALPLLTARHSYISVDVSER